MLSYTVHEKPQPRADRIDRAEDLVFVRDGFSWLAMLFTPIWLLLHRLWWGLLGYVVIVIALQVVASLAGLGETWISLASIAANVIFGFEASSLRRWTLARRGWAMVGAVTGKSSEECERRFFEGWLPAQPLLASQPSAFTRRGAGPWSGLSGLMGSRS